MEVASVKLGPDIRSQTNMNSTCSVFLQAGNMIQWKLPFSLLIYTAVFMRTSASKIAL